MQRGPIEPHPLRPYLEADDDALQARWRQLQAWIRARFGKEPSIEVILFLVGVQSVGRGFEPELGKDAKQNLIMEGTYCAFETLGVYERAGMEKDGHWIWERVIDLPQGLSVEEQEKLLQTAVLRYFDDVLETPASHEG